MKKYNKIFAYLLSICFLFSSFAGIVPAVNAATLDVDRAITGIVSLPEGEVATHDLEIEVVAHNNNNTPDVWQDDINLNAACMISMGQSFTPYTITIPSGTPVSEFRISYRVYGDSSFQFEGYYTANGTTACQRINYMLDVSSGDRTDINLTILRSYSLSGTISRPEGASLAEAISVDINASDQGPDPYDFNDNVDYGDRITIAPGEMSANYQLFVVAGNYRIRYWMEQPIEGYAKDGYLSYNGGSTPISDSAAIISVTGSSITVANLTLLTGKSITGTISLPNMETAPAGGLQVDIFANADNGTPDGFDDVNTGLVVSIPEGSNSATYTLNVPDNVIPPAYKLRYRFFTSTSYLQEGYYRIGGMTANHYDASEVDVSNGNATNINLVAMKGYTISGTISRPAEASTSAPISIEIKAFDEGADPGSGYDDMSYEDVITIQPGAMSANYEITVPAGTYRIRYYMTQATEGYTRDGYYSDNGTVSSRNDASIFQVIDSNIAGRNLTLLTGKTISGMISLPNGEIAPAGGVFMLINAWSNNGTMEWFDDASFDIGLVIPEGMNSVPYSITVSDNIPQPSYRIKYNILTNTSYLRVGYYGTGGMVVNQNDASPVNVSGGSRTDINLTLLKGYILSGSVSRPLGASTEAPILVDVYATDQGVDPYNGFDDVNFGTSITIPTGAVSANYQFAVAPGNYRMRYWMRDSMEGLVQEGYLGDNGTTLSREEATIHAVTDHNITANNLTMLSGKTIAGNISLPIGQTAPVNGLKVDVRAWSDNGTEDGFDDYNCGTTVIIPEGENSVAYSITVPDNTPHSTYRIRYFIAVNTNYLNEGYYNTTGTVSRREAADMVDVNVGDNTDINLTILQGYVLSGTVSRPLNASTVAPISVEVSAIDEGADPNNGYDDAFFGTRIDILPGNRTANYQLVVPTGNYKVRYFMSESQGGYIREGYLGIDGGTTPIRNNVAYISVEASDISGKDLTLVPGSMITGTISLPNGDTAPIGGLRLNVDAWTDMGTNDGADDFNTNTTVIIPEGGSTAPFSLTILSGQTLTYRLGVNVPSNSIYTAPEQMEFTATGGVYAAPIHKVLNKSQFNGQILGPNGETIQYGFVEIQKTNGNGLPGVGTDREGRFSIGGLEDGEYILRAFKWESEFTSSREVNITILNGEYQPDSNNDPLTLRLTLPQITGTVFFRENEPATGGNIELRDIEGMWIANSNIRSDGSYSFGGLNPGVYVIKAYPYWDSTEYTPSKDETVVVTENDTVSLDVMLTVPQIRGTVTDADGNLAEQGWVEIYNKNAGMGMPGANIINGSYSFGGLSDGVYVLRARPEAGTQFTASTESEITISGGELTSGVIDLVFTTAQLAGTIYDPFDNTVEYGWVEIRRNNGEWIPGSPAGRNGQFTIGGLEDGSYIIKAYPNGGTRLTPSAEEVITITDGTASPATMNLYLTLPQVEGLLVSPEGELLPFGHIEIRKQNGQWVQGIGVDYDGYFAIGGLPEGTYIIQAYPGGNSQYCSSDEFELTIREGQIPEVIIIALNNPQLTGTVLTPDGEAATYGDVSVYSSDGRWVTGSSVSRDGIFNVGSLKDGTYEIKAYPDWNLDYCASESGIIVIRDGVYVGPPITLQLIRPLAIGTVKDPTGTNNVRFGWVDVKNYITGEWQNGYSVNESGRFSLGNLANGTYALRAMSDQNSQYANSEEMIIKVNDGIIYDEEDVEITDLVICLTEPKIIGKVVGPDGFSATSFGWVEVRTQEGEWITGGNVDFGGNFKLGKLGPAGLYIMKAYPDSYGDFTTSKDITIEIDDSGSIISADADALNNGILTIKLSEVQLTGVVVNTENAPASYGWVEVQKDMGDNRWDWINCVGFDWLGGFKLGGLEDGTYRLRAYPDQSDNSSSASTYYTITISDGVVTGCDEVNAFNPETNTIMLKFSVPQLTGKILGPNDEAVAYGWVEVRDQNNNYVTGIGAGKSGEFAISGLEPNQSYLIVAYPAYNSEFTESEAITVVIGADGLYSNNPVTLQLSAIQVRGTVIDPEDQLVNRGWVEIYLNDQWVASSDIDANGAYKFGGLEDGQYTILAFAEPGTAYANSQLSSFEIAGGSVVDPTTLDLALTTPQITGIVKMPGGTNAYEGWVEIGDENEIWFMSVPIGRDGTFKLPAGLANGNYTIQAFPAEGSTDGASDVLAFTIDGDPITLTLTFK